MRALDGKRPAAGARAAVHDLELDDYEACSPGGRSMPACATKPAQAPPLYGACWGTPGTMPEPIRAMHGRWSDDGERPCQCRTRTGNLARMAGWIGRLPQASADTPVQCAVRGCGGGETWTRTFGGTSFSSRQFAGSGRAERLLCERFGPLTFAMALVLRTGGCSWCCAAGACSALRCRCGSARARLLRNRRDGRFHFHVEISHPLTGLIVRYRGWLAPPRSAGCSGPSRG